MGKVIDLTGKRFGRLTVIEQSGFTKANKAKWLCKCDCGNKKVIIGASLMSGRTKSCGCYSRDITVKNSTKHGLEGTRLCWTLRNMKRRCSNPKDQSYKYYGAKGVKVCDEWADKDNGLKNFAKWAYANGYDENAERGECTIDRIDVNGNYEPDNCRWVNLDIQANNKTNNIILEHNGEKDTLENWCKRLNLSRSMIRHRIERGWKGEKLFEKPKIKPVLVTYNGETKTLKEWSEITGIKYNTLKSRLNSGWEVERLLDKLK